MLILGTPLSVPTPLLILRSVPVSHSNTRESVKEELGKFYSLSKVFMVQIIKQKKELITKYPNSIVAGHLYLGTRQQALDLEMMKLMGITHIIRLEPSHHL